MDGSGATLRTVAKVNDLDRNRNEANCKNSTLPEQNTDMRATHVLSRAGNNTICDQLAVAERRITTLKAQSGEAQLAIETLTGMLSKTEADLRGQAIDVKETLTAGEFSLTA